MAIELGQRIPLGQMPEWGSSANANEFSNQENLLLMALCASFETKNLLIKIKNSFNV